MGELPDVRTRPPLRCFERIESLGLKVCGQPAAYQRVSKSGGTVGYFCQLHKRDGDQVIPREPVFQEIELVVSVTIAGVSTSDAFARAEAVGRVEALLRPVAGPVTVGKVSSRVVRHKPQAPAGWEKSGEGVR